MLILIFVSLLRAFAFGRALSSLWGYRSINKEEQRSVQNIRSRNLNHFAGGKKKLSVFEREKRKKKARSSV